MSTAKPSDPQITPFVSWLILGTAALGFAFDIYELLMWPLVGPPAIAHFEGVRLGTDEASAVIASWMGFSLYIPALCGGVFGLFGGWLTDRFGRRAVLTYSILLYAVATFAGGFAPTLWFLILCRCLAFVGVCVEFVAAVAWLAEIYTDPEERERAIGFTQAFSSIGGLMVTGMYALILFLVGVFPETLRADWAWRYLLMSGLIPAIPLIIVRPFLPESPQWEKKSAEGTLRRPDIFELFQPRLITTTIATTVMFACSYGIAFGAIQQITQIVPNHPEVAQHIETNQLTGPAMGKVKQEFVKDVQLWQEVGGLVGRFVLAVFVSWLGSSPYVLRIFQVPALVIVPLTFWLAFNMSLFWLQWGMFFSGLFTIAQFSYWGNYLPRAYPIHLRGTGESFAANIGGRMIGTFAALVTTQLAVYLPAETFAQGLAMCAAGVAFTVSLIGTVYGFFLPDPAEDEFTKDVPENELEQVRHELHT